LQGFALTSFDLQIFPDDGHQYINGNFDPVLGFYRVIGSAVKGFDPKILFDPFEEEINMPSASVQFRDCDSRQFGVVSEEHQPAIFLRVMEGYSPQPIGINFGRQWSLQVDDDVTSQSHFGVHWMAEAMAEIKVAFCADHKEGTGCGETVQAFKVQISTIHHIKRIGLDRQQVYSVHIVQFSLENINETRNVSAYVQKSMQLDCGLASSEFRPGNYAQAKVDGRGIESVDSFLQAQSKRLVRIQITTLANQDLREVVKDAPIHGPGSRPQVCFAGPYHDFRSGKVLD